MKRKFIVRGLYVAGISIVLLLGILVIHIAMVTKNKNDDKRNRQMARIDFKQDIDSANAAIIKNKVLSIEGVDAAYFNVEDNILVYSYNPDSLHSDLVYYNLMNESDYKAERFSVNADQLANGCPVIDKSSISYQFASVVQNIFNN
jgi:hypothetical protein